MVVWLVGVGSLVYVVIVVNVVVIYMRPVLFIDVVDDVVYVVAVIGLLV